MNDPLIARSESPEEKKLRRFLEDQLEEMLRHKYIESEKACRDLGPDALLDWIKKYAARYRMQWIECHGEIVNGECHPKN